MSKALEKSRIPMPTCFPYSVLIYFMEEPVVEDCVEGFREVLCLLVSLLFNTDLFYGGACRGGLSRRL